MSMVAMSRKFVNAVTARPGRRYSEGMTEMTDIELQDLEHRCRRLSRAALQALSMTRTFGSCEAHWTFHNNSQVEEFITALIAVADPALYR